MNCFQIEVRGVTFTIWAPTLREAVETFMIDMDFFEVPKDMMECYPTPSANMFPPEVTGFQSFFLDCLRIRANKLMQGEGFGLITQTPGSMPASSAGK